MVKPQTGCWREPRKKGMWQWLLPTGWDDDDDGGGVGGSGNDDEDDSGCDDDQCVLYPTLSRGVSRSTLS